MQKLYKIISEQKKEIEKWNLLNEEQKLFFAMRVYDQRHVLNVAYTAQKIIEQNQSLMANHSTFILYLFKRFNIGIDEKIFFDQYQKYFDHIKKIENAHQNP